MDKKAKILVLGGRGLVGSAIKRALEKNHFTKVLAPTREQLDLSSQKNVLDFFSEHRPEYVLMAAAKVGGIVANNTYRADFIQQNLLMQTNVFSAAYESKVRKLLFLGSSCIYPASCPQPIKEEYLLTGPLESTNEPYAIAKIAGLKTAESFRRQYGREFISAMPTNLYGEYDNFHPENSHVIPGMIQRLQGVIERQEKIFTVWGTGAPRREFLYVDDLANACLFLMNSPGPLPDYINIGTGEDLTIADLAHLIARLMGFTGDIHFDATRPDGTLRKVLDVSKIKALGWAPQISLEEGLTKSIAFFRNHRSPPQ